MVRIAKNKDISDILIKVSTLNDFYSSNLKKIVTAAAKTFRVADSTAYHWLKEVRSGKWRKAGQRPCGYKIREKMFVQKVVHAVPHEEYSTVPHAASPQRKLESLK